VVSGSITQSNFLGTGNLVSLQLNTGKVNTVYAFSFLNPYWTTSGVSWGYDLYKRDVDANSLNLSAYKTATLGAATRWGIPIGEDDTISFGIGYEHTDISLFPTSPARFIEFVAQFGSSVSSLPGTVTWARDRRDSAIYPTSGLLQRAFGEVGLPGFDLTYYKLSYQAQWFYPITRDFTLMLNGEAGYAAGYSNKPLPFFKNFYAGGITSVRGYESGTIGPKDAFGDAVGGGQRYVANAELLFPVPGLKGDKSSRLGVFFDAGMIRNSQVLDQSEFQDPRYSTGVSAFWVSPFGPLKFSLAKALNARNLDKTQAFQFQVGSSF
jgi:outer membrane protein insertion porin family